MQLKVGSTVRFLNDTGGGKIIAIRDGNIAVVETDDGFEVPVQAAELIPDEGNLYDDVVRRQKSAESQDRQKKMPDKTKAISYEEKKYVAFKGEAFLAIVPENEQLLHVSNFCLYLLNKSNYYFSYVIGKKESGSYSLIRIASVKPGKISEVGRFSQTEMTKVTDISLQGTFYKYGLFDRVPPVEQTFNLENISFYKIGYFRENKYFDSKAILLKKEEPDMEEIVKKLSENEILRVKRQKEEHNTKTPVKITKPETEEVDLHIEEILETRFETSLETALRSGVPKIVFIHGVGNGKLKSEICKMLDRKYPDLKYQDASFKEYGFGATMVYLK